MIPVFQKTTNDCFRCCIAAMLELPYKSVPDFMHARSDAAATIDYNELAEMDDWFGNRRMQLLRFPVPADSIGPALIRASGIQPRGVEYIIGGRTIKGVGHAHVACGAQIILDPAQPSQPLFAPFEGGYFMTYFIGMKL